MRPLTLLFVCLALSGCLTGGTIQAMRYYTVAPKPVITPGANTGKSLGVRPLIGAKPYKAAIAFAAEDNRLGYYQNAEWADLPATTVNRALVDGLIQLGAFSEVDDAANMSRPDLILTGELRRYEADFTRETPAAVVEVSCTLRDQISGASLWQGYQRAETPLALEATGESRHSDAALAAVATAMEQSVAALVTATTEAIAGALK